MLTACLTSSRVAAPVASITGSFFFDIFFKFSSHVMSSEPILYAQIYFST